MDELKPVLAYRFYVRMLDGNKETSMHAQHVTGLSYSLNVSEFNSTGGVKMMPTDVTYGNLTIKRAILEEAVPMGYSTSELLTKLEVQQIDMAIHLLDDEGKYVRSWNINDAYTINWSTSDFDTTSNDVLLETIEFKYSSLREVT
jgi:phage tail-like protein